MPLSGYLGANFPGDGAYPRLISLWDMLEFNAAYFLEVVRILTYMQESAVKSPDNDISDANQNVLESQLINIIDGCKRMGPLQLSIIYAEHTLNWVRQEKRTYGEIQPRVGVLRDRIKDELSTRLLLSLSTTEADHFANFKKDWEKAIERFPEAFSDIEEARKCFALNRYSAAVFHSTQIVEYGLVELGKFLKVRDPKSGWAAVTNALSNVIRKDHRARTRFEKKNYAFLEQTHGTVEALKDAWRNKVSHAHGRLVLLTTDFTPAVTEEILIAVRGFMRRLGEGLPPPKTGLLRDLKNH
jgi:hypothetical protein